MSTQSLTRKVPVVPKFFENMDEFYKPWNEWFNFPNRMSTVPAVNILETDKEFQVELAAPGMKKDDFKIDLAGNILTIGAEIEDTKEEKDEKYTRKEYNYSSFSRSFTLPEDVNMEKIEAIYQDGLLKLMLPKRSDSKMSTSKKISVK